MNVESILSKAREQAGVTATDYSDDVLIDYFNHYYQEIRSIIGQFVKEDMYITEQLIHASVAFEYYDTSSYNVFKVQKVSIKPTITSQTFVPCRERKMQNDYEHDIDYYLLYESLSNPRYSFYGNKLFILPAFTAGRINGVSNNQIKLTFTPKVTALAKTATEADILLDPEYHWGIVAGVKGEIYAIQQATSKKNDAKYVDYDAWVKKTTKLLTDRFQDEMGATFPDENALMGY